MQLDNHEYTNVMLDLETLGTNPGDAVISIGAAMFDPDTGSIGPMFHTNVDVDQLITMGFGVTGGTLRWWMQQSDDARKRVLAEQRGVTDVLMGFASFVTHGEEGINPDMKVWGNGAAFDNVLLREMYRRVGMQEPWQFWNDRCFRTLKSFPNAKELEPTFEGTAHDALHDALHQAKWAVNLFNQSTVFTTERVLEPDDEQMELPLDSEGGSHD